MLHYTVHHSTAQHSTAQYSTVQYSIVQFSTIIIQYNKNTCFAVYDTMGYMEAVNTAADASIAASIQDVKASNSYQEKHGAVSCNIHNGKKHYKCYK